MPSMEFKLARLKRRIRQRLSVLVGAVHCDVYQHVEPDKVFDVVGGPRVAAIDGCDSFSDLVERHSLMPPFLFADISRIGMPTTASA
jgi:hypothetical protein